MNGPNSETAATDDLSFEAGISLPRKRAGTTEFYVLSFWPLGWKESFKPETPLRVARRDFSEQSLPRHTRKILQLYPHHKNFTQDVNCG